MKVAAFYQSATNTELFHKTGEHLGQEKFIDPSNLADVVVFMLSRSPKAWLHDEPLKGDPCKVYKELIYC